MTMTLFNHFNLTLHNPSITYNTSVVYRFNLERLLKKGFRQKAFRQNGRINNKLKDPH